VRKTETRCTLGLHRPRAARLPFQFRRAMSETFPNRLGSQVFRLNNRLRSPLLNTFPFVAVNLQARYSLRVCIPGILRSFAHRIVKNDGPKTFGFILPKTCRAENQVVRLARWGYSLWVTLAKMIRTQFRATRRSGGNVGAHPDFGVPGPL